METYRLSSAHSPQFAECWSLYESAFPPEERRLLPCHLAAMQEAEAFHALRLADDRGFVGILFYWKTPSFIYVEHLAITPARRGQGLGHRALELVTGQSVPVILEIEPVEDAVTERRWNFYRSAGFQRLPFLHVQPVYRRGDAPMRLELLSYPHAVSDSEVAAYEAFMRSEVSHYTEDGLIKP